MGLARKKSGEGDTVSQILRDLKNDDWTVRQAAVLRIASLQSPEFIDDLIEGTAREKWFIREMVAAGIRSIENPALARSMEKGLRNDDDIIRNACIRALGLMHYREAEDLLVAVLKDPDSRVRKTARLSLEMIREQSR